MAPKTRVIKKAVEPVIEEEPVGPPMKQEIHFVLKVHAVVVEPPLPSSVEEGTGAEAQGAAATTGVAPNASAAPSATTATAEDPLLATLIPDLSTLQLQLQFQPWVGDNIILPPASLQLPSSSVPHETGAPAAASSTNVSSDGMQQKAEGSAATAMEAHGRPEVCTAGPREYRLEHHFKMTADEALVRAMASHQGGLLLPVVISSPPPPVTPPGGKSGAGGKNKQAADATIPPPSPAFSRSGNVVLDCCGLLVGDTGVTQQWPGKKTGHLPGELPELLQCLTVSLQMLSVPPPPPDAFPPASGGKKSPAPKAAAPGKGGATAGPGTAESELAALVALPGEPLPLMTPDLALKLNPIVIQAMKAKHLPDAPATRDNLDNKCEPLKLRLSWIPKASPRELPGQLVSKGSPRELPGQLVSKGWKVSEDDLEGDRISCRDVLFTGCEVLLAGDYTVDELTRWSRECPLVVEVHDRTAIPDPPEFPVASSEGEDPSVAGEDEGYVCGIARLSLLDLSKNYTSVRLRGPILPHTTIRGAASLDWTKRPGNYAQANSMMKVNIRTAVPLSKTVGIPQADKVFCKAVFVMDYRDSDLFHTLEDTLRKQNAWKLGLTAPVTPVAATPILEEEEAIRKQVLSDTSGLAFLLPTEDLSLGMHSTTAFHRGSTFLRPGDSPVISSPSFRSPSMVKQSLPLSPFKNASTAIPSQMKPMMMGTAISCGLLAPGPQPAGSPSPGMFRKASLAVTPTGGTSLLMSQGKQAGSGGSQGLHAVFHSGGGGGGSRPNSPGKDGSKSPKFKHHSGVSGGAGGSPRASFSAGVRTTSGNGRGDPSDHTVAVTSSGKNLRFRGRLGGRDDDSEAESKEEPMSPAEARMVQAMGKLENINIDMRLLQSLSTYKLTQEQASDTSLDILTGFHLVDGKERMIVLEGLVEGVMKVVKLIQEWALSEPKPEESWGLRHVVFNPSICYSTRLWPDLGVDLYIIKVRAHMPKLISEAGSYATGKVRVDCIQGLKKLQQLRTVTWARQADDLCMYPSPHMIRLVDKKFGGELNKADVMGVEVDEVGSDDTDEEEGAVEGLLGTARASSGDLDGSRQSGSRKSVVSKAASRRSRKSKKSKAPKKKKIPSRIMPLDMDNEAYLIMREKARQRRLSVSWLTTNKINLVTKEEAAESKRATWREWNPQRAAAKQLEELVRNGTLTLQDTIMARSAKPAEALPGCIPPEASLQRGWYPHSSTFKWPAPKEPGSFNKVANKPSDFRIEQLADSWVEAEMFRPLELRGNDPSLPTMHTVVKNPAGTFGQDPEYFKTVHLGGTGRAKEEEEDKLKERSVWKSKLVVSDPVVRATLPTRHKTAQVDRSKHILHDPPKKKGFKAAHVPPAPYSMFLAEPHVQQGLVGGSLMRETKFNPSATVSADKDFARDIAKDKRDLHKPALNQSWQASLHDPYYDKS
ncbi:hypothetical protein CEUSTIGMA_g47.t1 [Chlamydomonas eustigma]|uniref:Uncharacterized protein n=1 Tax=Chlamydomonas eustigma TaxID=1157962 RepID=A0A250WP82_9CHLO|nr:hypothetical protein CEUSTIGMA_g47.t1 [Chlamydomonas eustigma]|eukprot:GAX72591.1 hypothetical protein CEUSTIGMA_g47.t1 [Chlamydomonas eustigma]